MTDNVTLLREAADKLQAAYDRRRAEMGRDIGYLAKQRGVTPEDMRDSAGRSILLDALTTLVNARAALALTGEEA